MGLILASASPRRQELLRLITNDFTVFPAAVDESLPPALSVDNAAQYLARKKAAAVSSAFPDDIVLGSDTTVIIDHTILGKPGTPERAEEMMRRLSGKTHTVITGVALAKGKEMLSFQTSTDVTFYPLTEKQIQDYIATKQAAMAYKAMAHSWCKKSAVISTVLSDFLLQKPLGHWKNSKNNKSSCEQK